MRDPAGVAGFLALAITLSLIWGLVLWYFDERAPSFRLLVFYVMGFTRRKPGEVRSLLLSLIYYGIGLLASLILAVLFDVQATAILSWAPAYFVLSVLGIIAEISLTNLFVDVACRVTGQGGPEQFAEIRQVPWMKGLMEFPAPLVPIAAAFGGIVEEIFFRGVLVHILAYKLSMNPVAAVAIAGVLFCMQQLVQLRTPFQMMVIGSGCVAISLVGGLLVVATGSLIPAVVCHASFVIFFMTQGNDASAGSSARQTQAVAK